MFNRFHRPGKKEYPPDTKERKDQLDYSFAHVLMTPFLKNMP